MFVIMGPTYTGPIRILMMSLCSAYLIWPKSIVSGSQTRGLVGHGYGFIFAVLSTEILILHVSLFWTHLHLTNQAGSCAIVFSMFDRTRNHSERVPNEWVREKRTCFVFRNKETCLSLWDPLTLVQSEYWWCHCVRHIWYDQGTQWVGPKQMSHYDLATFSFLRY